ncbi:hypothetical protein [Saccharothrix saharensis]|uniref:hypothetical protein n=1 Tax=Saccharothrix saharensis TaxID=571190 RepID=UPI0011501708|nr:hypothetical protein [Saccharothrix saharensis]
MGNGVLGPPDRPGAAGPAAGAMLNCFGEVTRLTDRHPAARAKFAFAREALDRWPARLDRLVDDAGPEAGRAALDSHVPGTFVVPANGAGTIAEDNFAALRRAALDCHKPHDLVDPADVPGLAAAPHARPGARCTCTARGASTRAPCSRPRWKPPGGVAWRWWPAPSGRSWPLPASCSPPAARAVNWPPGCCPSGRRRPCRTARDRRCCSGGPDPGAPRTSSARPTAARAAACTSCRCP